MHAVDLFAGAGGTSTLGSLFSGIGGLDLAVEAVTGARTVWQVEADPWCRSVLARHWPDARRYDDVRTVGEELERVDIIAGGFPCQDVSVAGKRAGITGGERSGLWSEFARIVRVVRPRIVFVENVSGLLSMEFGRVLGDLAALGFDAEWGVFRASDAGAPHRRERVFVLAVAHPERRGRGEGWLPRVGCPVVSGGDRADDATTLAHSSVGALADAERREGIERCDADMLGRRSGDAEQARVGGGDVADAAGSRREGTTGAFGAGGGRVSGIARSASEAMADANIGRLEGERERGVLHGQWEALRHDADRRDGASVADARCERLQGIVSAGATPGAVDGRSAGSRRAQPRLGGVADGLPCGLDAHRWPTGRGEAQHEWEPPRVAQSVPQRRQRLKALGNAVVPQQAALALRELAARGTSWRA